MIDSRINDSFLPTPAELQLVRWQCPDEFDDLGDDLMADSPCEECGPALAFLPLLLDHHLAFVILEDGEELLSSHEEVLEDMVGIPVKPLDECDVMIITMCISLEFV